VLVLQVLPADQAVVVVVTNQPVASPEVLRFNQLQPQVDMEILAEMAQTLLVAAAAVQEQPALPMQVEPDENGLLDQVHITVAVVVAVMVRAVLEVAVLLVAPQAHQILAEVEGEEPEQVVLV